MPINYSELENEIAELGFVLVKKQEGSTKKDNPRFRLIVKDKEGKEIASYKEKYVNTTLEKNSETFFNKIYSYFENQIKVKNDAIPVKKPPTYTEEELPDYASSSNSKLVKASEAIADVIEENSKRSEETNSLKGMVEEQLEEAQERIDSREAEREVEMEVESVLHEIIDNVVESSKQDKVEKKVDKIVEGALTESQKQLEQKMKDNREEKVETANTEATSSPIFGSLSNWGVSGSNSRSYDSHSEELLDGINHRLDALIPRKQVGVSFQRFNPKIYIHS